MSSNSTNSTITNIDDNNDSTISYLTDAQERALALVPVVELNCEARINGVKLARSVHPSWNEVALCDVS